MTRRSVSDTTVARDLLRLDRDHLWHPYTAARDSAHHVVRDGDGPWLTLLDADGREHRALDGMGSWWAMVHGHRHPALVEAVTEQASRLAHVMFGGLTHGPAVALAERLLELTPAELEHVFLADSGSVSVEVALKLTHQAQAARGRPERDRFLTVRGGYHGDTIGAMSVCDPVNGMHAAFGAMVHTNIFAPRPPAARPTAEGWQTDDAALESWAHEFRRLADQHHDEVAGVIVEPVLQGAGGMYVYAPEALRVMREVCDEHGFTLIADEIATGFGRTGRWLACEWAEVVPDVLCLGKALTGGIMTGAAVLCTREIADAISSGTPPALMHGPTFMANPLFCAAACASLDLLADPENGWSTQVPTIERGLQAGLDAARGLPGVADVRVLGGVGVVEMTEPVDLPRLTAAAVARGVWLRPFGRLVYVMPPYISTPAGIEHLCSGLVGAVADAAHTQEANA